MINEGQVIKVNGGGYFTVVKKYNEVVWRLKSDTGEIVNIFYSLSQQWEAV